MKLTFHGHAACEAEIGAHRIWMDPFLTGNPMADVDAGSVEADYIILSHGHQDHYGDTEAIAARTGATVIAMNELAIYLQGKRVTAEAIQIGAGQSFPFGRVELTQALHSSSLDGTYLGSEAGILVRDETGKTLYHAGDTGLFGDMELIGRKGIDVALIPIGDKYTMGPEDGLTAVELLRPGVAIPIHYGTFPAIDQDAEAWKEEVEKRTQTEVAVLAPGESYTVG